MRLLNLQQNFRGWLESESPQIAAHLGERVRPGLAVYLNNYRAQLLSCLSASFPVLRAWLGDSAFEAAGARHIDNVPPSAWTLDAYGVDFPETLTALFPDNPEIAELACLERALAAAFVGRDASPVDPAYLPDIDWATAIIQLVPTFTCMLVTTNVVAIWCAINDGETPPPATCLTVPAHVAIWRDEFTPRFRTLTPEEAMVLSQVREGMTFGAICAALIELLGEKRGAATAGSLLGQWLTEHMVRRVFSNPARIVM